MNYARRQQYRRLSQRAGGAGERRRRVARARGRERGRGVGRWAAAPHGRRTRCLRSPLALARAAQSSRRPLRGRGAARARCARGRGLAASALSALAGPRRHRLGRHRSDRDRRRDRDEDEGVRHSPSRSRARTGGTAVPTAAKVGPRRRPCRDVPPSGRVASSASTTTFWWSRSTGCLTSCAPRRGWVRVGVQWARAPRREAAAGPSVVARKGRVGAVP